MKISHLPFPHLRVHSALWLDDTVPTYSRHNPAASLLVILERLVVLHSVEVGACTLLRTNVSISRHNNNK